MPVMDPMAPAALLAAQRWRYATKRFDPARRIPAAVWDALEESLVLTPSSYGLQPWRFVVVTDPALKAALRPLSWNQPQVTECSHYVVLAHRDGLTEADLDRLIDRTADVRGLDKASLAGYRGMMAKSLLSGAGAAGILAWAAHQAYIALGNLMTSAAVLGVDACPMEGIEPARYDEVLGLPARGYRTVVACALGYRAPEDRYAGLAKVRYPRHEVVEHR